MEKTLSEYISLSKNIETLNLEKKIKVAIMSSFTLNGFEETMQVQCNVIIV